jgi:hypothetical protein
VGVEEGDDGKDALVCVQASGDTGLAEDAFDVLFNRALGAERRRRHPAVIPLPARYARHFTISARRISR